MMHASTIAFICVGLVNFSTLHLSLLCLYGTAALTIGPLQDSEELAGTGPEAPWLPRRLAREVIAPAARGKDRWFHQTTHLLFLLRATWTPVNPSAGAVGGRQVDAAAALVQDRRGQTTPLLLLTILLLRATWTPTATALVPGNPSAVTVGGGTPSGARCCGRGCATRRLKSGRSSAASARAPSPRAAT